jgi:DNA-binding NtrC family response regulator
VKTMLSIVTAQPPNVWAAETAATLRAFGPVEFVSAASFDASMLDESRLAVIDAKAMPAADRIVALLRSRPSTADLRIVVMTASPTWRRARSVLEAGAMDYLPKSINSQKLKDAISEALTNPLRPVYTRSPTWLASRSSTTQS